MCYFQLKALASAIIFVTSTLLTLSTYADQSNNPVSGDALYVPSANIIYQKSSVVGEKYQHIKYYDN